jgi:23S rRNA (cytosine1962-C5)-methyltransferase
MAEGQIKVSQRGADRIRSGHLWVYRSDIRSAEAQGGAAVRVTDEHDNFLGRAFFSSRSQITLRLITRDDVPIDREFLKSRILAAVEYRKSLIADAQAYRLIYGESDLIPSLVVDRYADWLVLQTLSQGTECRKQEIVSLLVEMFAPHGVLERNDPRVRELEGLERRNSVLYGDVPERIVAAENGLQFIRDLHTGQKTGAFLDQRENHRAAADYASGEVLDCFTYHGGFALTVAQRAAHVEATDLSGAAISIARENQRLNNISNVTLTEANAFDTLKTHDVSGRKFDTVILDPPAFAKNRESVPAAVRGYKEINLRAMKVLKPGGILITCSCSYHIPEPLFLRLLAEAANDAHRHLQIVERRTQARDHPILLTMPETHYLKCFVARIL